MIDYYDWLSRSIASASNTPDARQSIYERARNSISNQLAQIEPPLGQSEIARERLSLEEAIVQIEQMSEVAARTEQQLAAPINEAGDRHQRYSARRTYSHDGSHGPPQREQQPVLASDKQRQSRQVRSYLKIGLAIAACAVAVAIWWQVERLDERRREAVRIKAVEENAIDILPPGVQDAWLDYVQQQMDRLLRASTGGLYVDADGRDEITFVSSNSSYKVTCHPLSGAAIEFGYGDGSTTVDVFRSLRRGHPQPSLDVPTGSIAARNLVKALCDRITAHVSSMMSK